MHSGRTSTRSSNCAISIVRLTNTILVTILIVGGTLFTSIMGGYAFSRIRFAGRDKIFVAYIGSIMIPFVVLIVPLFRLMVALGWVDTLGSLVWPFLFNAYGTFLMRQFFVSIPVSWKRPLSSTVPAAGPSLWKIFVPLAWPAIATLATFMFLYAWNSFIWPLVSINLANSDDYVLTLASADPRWTIRRRAQLDIRGDRSLSDHPLCRLRNGAALLRGERGQLRH